MLKLSKIRIYSLLVLVSTTASLAHAHQNSELSLLPPKPLQMTEVSIPATDSPATPPNAGNSCIAATNELEATGAVCNMSGRYIYMKITQWRGETIFIPRHVLLFDSAGNNLNDYHAITNSRGRSCDGFDHSFDFPTGNRWPNEAHPLSILTMKKSTSVGPIYFGANYGASGRCQMVKTGDATSCYATALRAGPIASGPRIPLANDAQSEAAVRKLQFTETIKTDMRWESWACPYKGANNECYATLSSAQGICQKLGMRLPTIRELLYLHAPSGVKVNSCPEPGFSEVVGANAGGGFDRVCYRSNYKASAGDQHLWSATYDVRSSFRGKVIIEQYIKYWDPSNGGMVRSADPNVYRESMKAFRCINDGVGATIYSNR